jgi:hypothetical protein
VNAIAGVAFNPGNFPLNHGNNSVIQHVATLGATSFNNVAC